jgi:hypothetical protein
MNDRYSVEALFDFFNYGRTTTEWVGFPRRPSHGGAGDVSDFLLFETWVNGRKERFTDDNKISGMASRLKGLTSNHVRDSGWMLREVEFKGNSETGIRLRYECRYDLDFQTITARYVYGTGSFWKDSIAKISFTIDCADVGGVQNVLAQFPDILGGPRRVGDSILRFEVRDVEPYSESELEAVLTWPRFEPIGPQRPLSVAP